MQIKSRIRFVFLIVVLLFALMSLAQTRLSMYVKERERYAKVSHDIRDQAAWIGLDINGARWYALGTSTYQKEHARIMVPRNLFYLEQSLNQISDSLHELDRLDAVTSPERLYRTKGFDKNADSLRATVQEFRSAYATSRAEPSKEELERLLKLSDLMAAKGREVQRAVLTNRYDEGPLFSYVETATIDTILVAPYVVPAMGLAIACGFGYFLVRRIVASTTAIAHGAKRFGVGDFAYKIDVSGEDEFGVIAKALNSMANEMAADKSRLEEQNAEIKKQQELAESLLLNVLPGSIAEELKQKGAVNPKYHDDVTILFTDFQGFTLSTEKLAAEEVVASLHEYFTEFDKIAQRYGLEKLKTIGDSYMCVAGLPERRASHAVDAVLAAFAMIDAVRAAHGRGLPEWAIRIGVHTGPVISGVVGIQKFAYDVWGESVNFASRVESSGAPGRVNISSSTFQRVKDFFRCESRGNVRTKEGREYEMYFATALAVADDKAFVERYEKYFGTKLSTVPDGLVRHQTAKA